MHIHFNMRFTNEEIKLTGQPTDSVRDHIVAQISDGAWLELENGGYLTPSIEMDQARGMAGTLDFFIVSMDSYNEIKAKFESLPANDTREQLWKDVSNIIRK